MQRIPHSHAIQRPDYQVTSASFAGPKPGNRGLLFYPVSLDNQLHQADKLHAAIRLIRDIKHPDTDLPNVVVHVTDGIYAFNYQIANPNMPLAAARARADTAGVDWVNDHLTGIVEELGFQPVILHWDHWEDKHGEEYDSVLRTLEDMWQNQAHPFYGFVQKDVDAYISRHRNQLGTEIDQTETERIRGLSTQFVLHECAGYILIGRHIVKDYMDILHDQRPGITRAIQAHGGLMEGAYRLYPGGQLNSIEYLQKHSRKLAPEISGAGGVKPIRISLSQIPTSNFNALSNRQELKVQETVRKTTPEGNGAGSNHPMGTPPDTDIDPSGSRAAFRRPARHHAVEVAKYLL